MPDGVVRFVAAFIGLARPLLLRAFPRTVIIVPPSAPGSLGDEAMLLAAARVLRDEGFRVAVADSTRMPWSRWLSRPGATSFHARGSQGLVALAVRAAGAERAFVFGADVLDGFYGDGVVIDRVRRAETIRYAGCPLSIINFSLNGAPTPGAIRTLRRLPAGAVRFVARGQQSRERAERFLGVATEVAPDMAFLLDPEAGKISEAMNAWIAGQKTSGKRVVGVNFNVRLIPGHRERPIRDLATGFAKVLTRLLERPDISVFLLPHDRRVVTSDVTEYGFHALIRSLLPPDVLEKTHILSTECGAAELRAFLGSLDFVFTGRMHLMIAAICRNVPSIGVEYQDKFHETVAQAGLGSSAFFPAERLLDADAFVAAVLNGLAVSPATRAAMTARLPGLRESARRHLDAPAPPPRIISLSGFIFNPYETLLSAALRARGGVVELVTTPDSFANLAACPPDVFHVNGFPGLGRRGNLRRLKLILGCLLLRLRGTRIVWTPHDTFHHDAGFVGIAFEYPARLLMRMVSHSVVFHNSRALRTFDARFGRGKSELVPHGNYVSWYANDISREEARRRLDLPVDARVILFFGWWRRNKGLIELIDAFAACRDERLWLVIVGRPMSGDLRDEVFRKTAGLPRVRIVDDGVPEDDVQVYMNACDVVSLLYRGAAATSGVVLLAMSFGRAVICPDQPTFTDYVAADGALFATPDDPEGLAALLSSLPDRGDLLREMGVKNGERAKSFGWDATAERMLAVYGRVRRA